jgi:nitrogen fixation/metabolism regulation signal transduction histidine kinase
MAFRNYATLLTLRVLLLLPVMMGFTYLLVTPGYPVLLTLLAAVVALQLAEMLRFVRRTNRELTRFLEAVRYADFGQRFQMQDVGAGFDDLGEAFTDIVQRFQALRSRQEETLRHLKALMEHVPVPLMSVHQDGRLDVHNNAARRLFGTSCVERIGDLTQFGEDFHRQVQAVSPGERRLAVFRSDGIEQRLIISATEIAIASQVERLISLQNIQSELDGVQLQAWQDLVSVLTHEIMNSITPVASLARTATDLVEDAAAKVAAYPEVIEELQDVKSAVETVARRSDGLMHFVQAYRQLTRLPPPQRQRLQVAEAFDNAAQLVASSWEEKAIALRTTVIPESLSLEADPEMLEQMLLNLLKNAEQALAGRPSPQVEIRAYLNRHGRVTLDVSDNGPGIDPGVAEKIFVPFFTTKREGSGVGLALTRQIMLAHGGTAALCASEGGGARFTLTF